MKKILAFCASSYQILVVNRIIDQFYSNDDISLIVADTITDIETIYSNLKNIPRYENVYLWKIKNRFQYGKIKRITNAVIGWPIAKKILHGYEGVNRYYDVYLFSNLGLPMLYLGYMLEHVNPNLKIEMYEDGFNTYSKYYGDFLNSNRIFDCVTRRFFRKIESLYLFNPNILEWTPKFNIVEIKAQFQGALLSRINRIFDYDALSDDYDKKCIFFEESYFADGCEIGDIDILEIIAEFIPKKDIMVKIHPRNSINRFKRLGYTTNQNVSIPWEVIVINRGFDNTFFATLASNAAMNPFFLFGKKIPSYLLFRCVEKPELLRREIVEFDERLCSQFSDVFYIPNNIEEMRNMLEEKCKG